MAIETNSGSNDIFIYNQGDGSVQFDVGQGKDVVRLGAGLTSKSPVGLWQVDTDDYNWLEIDFGNGQVLTLTGFVGSQASIVFADGSVWDSAYANRLVNMGRSTGFDAVQVGTNKTKKLTGGSVDDLLIAGPINTTLEGGAGNDYLEGGKGKDTLLGGAGNDYLDGGAGNDSLNGGAGDDTLIGGTGADTLEGGDGNDSLSDTSGSDKLLGGAGNDDILVGGDKDTVDGGAGSDQIFVEAKGTQILFGHGSGQDSVYSGNGLPLGQAYTVRMGAGIKASDLVFSEEIIVSDEDDYTEENLKIAIKGGSDVLTLKGFYTQARAAHTLYDTILTFADGSSLNVAKVVNGLDADVFPATGKKDVFTLARGIGSDSVVGFAANDLVQLGSGLKLSDLVVRNTAFNDLSLSIAGSRDSLRLDDFFKGNVASSTVVVKAGDGATLTAAQLRALALTGTNGNDTIYGFQGADQISGGGGDDFIAGGGGKDTLDGGAGKDTLSGSGLLTGGDGNDSLFAIGQATLQGGKGDDRLDLGDTVKASAAVRFGLGDGHDRLDYFGTDDVIEFGTGVNAGNITARANEGVFSPTEFHIGGILQLSDGSTLELNGISDTSNATAVRFADGGSLSQRQLYAYFLRGTAGDDWLLDSHFDDNLNGLSGDDTMEGLFGNDTLNGGAGNDWLSDGAGNNVLLGGSGNDTLDVSFTDAASSNGSNVLDGGTGNDLLIGGALTAERYVFNRGYERDEIQFAAPWEGEVQRLDVVQLGASDASEVRFQRAGQNLEVGFTGASDTLVLDDWFATDSLARASVDHFELSNGAQLAVSSIDTLVDAMAAFASETATVGTILPVDERWALTKIAAAA